MGLAKSQHGQSNTMQSPWCLRRPVALMEEELWQCSLVDALARGKVLQLGAQQFVPGEPNHHYYQV